MKLLNYGKNYLKKVFPVVYYMVKWIKKIESADMTRGEFGLIEDLLDARSRLYAPDFTTGYRKGTDAT